MKYLLTHHLLIHRPAKEQSDMTDIPYLAKEQADRPEPPVLRLGDQVVIEGCVFYLVGFERRFNQPARVIFKDPTELEKEHLT